MCSYLVKSIAYSDLARIAAERAHYFRLREAQDAEAERQTERGDTAHSRLALRVAKTRGLCGKLNKMAEHSPVSFGFKKCLKYAPEIKTYDYRK